MQDSISREHAGNKFILRDTPNYQVTYYPSSKENLTIVFISAGRLAPGEPVEEFKRTLERFETSIIFILDRKSIWFNYSETTIMLREVAGVAREYQGVSAMGESMGACGALMASSAIPEITRVLAMSPQYSIAPPFINFDARYEPIGRSIGQHRYWHFADAPDPDRCTLLYGTLDWCDCIHSAMYAAHGFAPLYVDGATHNVAAFLKALPGNGLVRLVGAFLNWDRPFGPEMVAGLFPEYLTRQSLTPGYSFDRDVRAQHANVSDAISARLAAQYKVDTGVTLGPNLALGKPATQSSVTLWSRELTPEADAAGAVVGSVTGFYSFHTDADEPGPWWMVDLGATHEVMEVRAFNYLSNPGLAARCAHLIISFSCDAENWVVIYRHAGRPIFGGADGNPLVVRPDGLRATRFVRLSLELANYLHLDEVQVFGRPLSLSD